MACYTQMPGDMALEGIQLLLQLSVATKRKMWVMKRQHLWDSVLWYTPRAERSCTRNKKEDGALLACSTSPLHLSY